MFNILFLTLITSINVASYHANCVTLDYKLGHRFTPNCSGLDIMNTGLQTEFKHNSMGLRDQEYSKKAPKNSLRILFIGASEAVPYNDNEGIVPGLKKEINKLLLKSKLRKKYKKVEIIAAGESGYNIVQTYLRLPELLSEYNPDIVLFMDSYLGFVVDSMFFHFSAQEYEESGLVKNYGNFNQLYPIPEKYHSYIWNHPWNQHVRGVSIGFRKAVENYKLYFGLEKRCKNKEQESCINFLYTSYLSSIHKLAIDAGAKFIFLQNLNLDKNKSNYSFNNFKQTLKQFDLRNTRMVSNLLQPFNLPRNTDITDYANYLSNQPNLNIIDIYKEFNQRTIETYTRNPLDYHLDPQASTALGADIASPILDKIEIILSKKQTQTKKKLK
ncbi:MAG: hypothetical protein M9962_02505 [Oligoflexia bacterium]|nr:hypothetical protein [Oligoflexia bacterium]